MERFYCSPSKSTVPSPLPSASLTIASISVLLAFSPNNFIMAYLNSSEVIDPSPSISNYRKMEGKWIGLDCDIILTENTSGSPPWMHPLAPLTQSSQPFQPEAWESSALWNPQNLPVHPLQEKIQRHTENTVRTPKTRKVRWILSHPDTSEAMSSYSLGNSQNWSWQIIFRVSRVTLAHDFCCWGRMCLYDITHGSCWCSGSVLWAPFRLACNPWSSSSSPGLCRL